MDKEDKWERVFYAQGRTYAKLCRPRRKYIAHLRQTLNLAGDAKTDYHTPCPSGTYGPMGEAGQYQGHFHTLRSVQW
jgi:hypothetical protein